MALPSVNRRSASDLVRSQLIELIESGEYKVNDRLPSENELSRTFGVSRPVIREALQSLGALGLTNSQSGRGTFVVADKPTTPQLFGHYSPRHLREVRITLEVPAARFAALRRSEDDVEAMRQTMAALSSAPKASAFHELDAQFHVQIAEATGNPLFSRLIDGLRSVLQEQSHAMSSFHGRRDRAIAEHYAILEAIIRRDPRSAGEAMAAHLDAVAALQFGGETLPEALPSAFDTDPSSPR